MIRDLLQIGVDSIDNMHIVNNDALSYQNKSPNKFLQTAEKEMKWKYLEYCFQLPSLLPFCCLS